MVGINHRTAPVEVREKLAFSDENVSQAYAYFREKGFNEIVLLSTCNRTEIYLTRAEKIPLKVVARWWASFFNQDPEEVFPHLYQKEGEEAVRHLFRVACGLDSMMLGETQIHGQVREAYQFALEGRWVGPFLGEVFRRALKVGRRARAETAISKGALSVGGAAVELAKRIFADLRTCSVLLIGAGKMGKDTARALIRSGCRDLLVCNRTFEKALALANELGGQVIPFERLAEQLISADVIIASTGATQYLVTRATVQEAVTQRGGRPLFFIDIAVPRNIDPEVGRIETVFLFDIDDLERIVDTYVQERQGEVQKVEHLIEQELSNFQTWLGERKAKPLLLALVHQAQEMSRQAADNLFKELPHLSDKERQVIRAKMHALAMRLFHRPLSQIKRLAEKDGLLSTAQELLLDPECVVSDKVKEDESEKGKSEEVSHEPVFFRRPDSSRDGLP
ncbi:MAG: glutamyl-tRNA reductase [Armatimonadetes bacterium]|nr:glutamyl-tRNA reductase [Armatimonadota bacterium]MDW8121339.1 glutamyl-tRNA reductase [Armatimonadota bacterium]